MIILLVFDHWVIYVSIMDLIVVVEYLSEAKFYDKIERVYFVVWIRMFRLECQLRKLMDF